MRSLGVDQARISLAVAAKRLEPEVKPLEKESNWKLLLLSEKSINFNQNPFQSERGLCNKTA